MKKRIILPALLCTLLQLTLPGGSQAASLGLVQGFPDFVIGSSLSYSFDATTGVLKIGHYEVSGGDGDGVCEPGETCSTSSSSIVSFAEGDAPAPQWQVTGQSPYLERFSLYAVLDSSGNVVSGAFRIDGIVRPIGWTPACTAHTSACQVEINGVLLDGSDVSGGLWSGKLTQFGWEDPPGSAQGPSGFIEFIFSDASGILGSEGLGYGGGGMIFHINNARQTTAGTPLLTDFGSQLLTVSWTATGNGGDVFVPVPAAVWLFGSGLLALLGVARRRTRRVN